MGQFETEYRKLNKQQRAAVDVIEGPVMVIAGPGTGKTQLLGMRVANILTKTDTMASSILCLTFTNKAATNMRERLLSLVGPTSHNVMVKTFHGFAAEIMNLYPDYFWNGARLATVPEAVQLDIIQDILSDLPLDNPLALKFAGSFSALNDVLTALKLTKEAGLTPEKLRAVLNINLAYIDIIEPQLIKILEQPLSAKKLPALQAAIDKLPDQQLGQSATPLLSMSTLIKEGLAQALAQDEGSNKTINCGKWKKRWIQTVRDKKGMFDERKRNSWWLAVADVYGRYRNELQRRGYYDYADMIVEVISRLEQHPELLADVQERFLYVLVDEFQDTNAAQLRLAQLVADHESQEGRPNLMVVGDDDQSIFKFNGAELNNMRSFRRSYPDTCIVVLESNYRSSQAILNTATRIIEQAEFRLVNQEPDISKRLLAVLPPKQKGKIQHLAYFTRDHQLTEVAKAVKKSHSQGSSIAVLGRSHASLRQMAAILLQLGVPVRYEQQNNILEHDAVIQVCLIAELVVAIQEGDESVVNACTRTLLQHPMWKLDSESLWRLALVNYSQPHWLDSMLRHQDRKLHAIGHWLLWLSSQARAAPLPLLLEYILGLRESEHLTSPIRGYFTANKEISSEYLQTLSAIQLLRALVSEFSPSSAVSLTDLVRLVKLNQANHKIIANESHFTSGERGVELLTVHKAKGLEFDTVWIIDAIEDEWQPRSGRRKAPANLPLQPYGDDYDDYVRLMYVAATRARHTLFVASYNTDQSGKELLATPLIRTILPPTAVNTKDAADVIQVLENSVRWPRLHSGNEAALLKDRLETYSLSVTGLLNFLDVTNGGPRYFFERNLLRLPEAKTPTMAYGTAMHAALETAQRLVNANRFVLGNVMNAYEKALIGEHMPPYEFERYLVHGQGILGRLFNDNLLELPKGSQAEYRLSNILLGGATINGILDRVDLQDKSRLFVVDYKTGKPLNSFDTKDRTKAIKAWKHRTQLIFYTLLARHAFALKDYGSFEGHMIYLEADQARDLIRTYVPSKEETSRLELLVNAVWHKIMKIEFPDVAAYTKNIQGIMKFEDDLITGTI